MTTVTSLGPSTLLRLRRSPGHYIGFDQATQSHREVKALETSLGTKDSSNLVYDADNAATPNHPWGTARQAGKVFTEPKDFGGEISARLIGIVIGGIFGLVFILACVWWIVKRVQKRRAFAKEQAMIGEMEQH